MNSRLYKPLVGKKRKRISEKLFPISPGKTISKHEKITKSADFVQSEERIEEVFSNSLFESKKVKKTKIAKLERTPAKKIPIVMQTRMGKRRPDRIRSPRTAHLCDHAECHQGT